MSQVPQVMTSYVSDIGKWSVKCTVFVYFMLIAICGVYLI